jgi:23S rRNA (guanine2535-N1)-methyltransferase
MPYRFATENRDYSDFASGRFFYAAPGHPALPVRLTSEIFQRCLAYFRENGRDGPVTLYDPTCGGAYHLSTLAYLHWEAVDTIIASDVDPDILTVAKRNLGLLTEDGVQRRADEIAAMIERFGKGSHTAALESAQYFNESLNDYTQLHQIKTHLFMADATDSQQLAPHLQRQAIDLVFSDVPYGRHSSWQQAEEASGTSPLSQMMGALRPFLRAGSLAAIILDKGQRFSQEGYRQVEKFQIGKRRVVLLKPA